MASRPALWAVSFETAPAFADIFSDALDAENLLIPPLALTTLAPPRGTTAKIEAIFAEKPDKAALTAALAVAAALSKTKLPRLLIRELPNLDWIQKVAGDFPPLRIARWTVHGAHHRYRVPDRRRALQIDATSAFGTGEHPTTRGCLLMLDAVLKKGCMGRKMLDMGCGSGILAMAWAKEHRDRGKALGIDTDTDSVRIATENAAANGLRGQIRAGRGRGYTRHDVKRGAPYDLIMANIFARPLASMAKDLRRHLRPGGTAILSGLLKHQSNRVLAAHRLQRLYPIRIFYLGEWAVLVLKRRG